MTIKKGAAVRGTTVSGTRIKGVIAAVETHRNGKWFAVKLADGSKVKTRESRLRAA